MTNVQHFTCDECMRQVKSVDGYELGHGPRCSRNPNHPDTFDEHDDRGGRP